MLNVPHRNLLSGTAPVILHLFCNDDQINYGDVDHNEDDNDDDAGADNDHEDHEDHDAHDELMFFGINYDHDDHDIHYEYDDYDH